MPHFFFIITPHFTYILTSEVKEKIAMIADHKLLKENALAISDAAANFQPTP
jgi:hypothetical protein